MEYSEYSGSDDELDPDDLQEDEPLWDYARHIPPTVDSGSEASSAWIKSAERGMKFFSFVISFLTVLCGAVVCKATTLFIIAQLSVADRRLPLCNERMLIADQTKDYEINRYRPQKDTLDEVEKKQLEILENEQVGWIWVLIFAYAFPEVVSWIWSFRGWFLKKSINRESEKSEGNFILINLLFVFLMETLHASGVATLAFVALPSLDSAYAAIFSNCVAFVPSILVFVKGLGSRNRNGFSRMSILGHTPVLLDLIAVVCQLGGILIIPILYFAKKTQLTPTEWSLPVGLLLTSCGWWECFVAESNEKTTKMMKWLHKTKTLLNNKYRHMAYFFIAPWKMLVFLGLAIGFNSYTGVLLQPVNIFKKFKTSFNSHEYNATEIMDILTGTSAADSAFEPTYVGILSTLPLTPLYVLIVQIISGLVTYIFANFACKVIIQKFSFSFALSLVVPTTITLTLTFCGLRANDKCIFDNFIPEYLFFECPAIGDYTLYLREQESWIWILWFLSYFWICRHIWFPKSPKMAPIEQIFATPMYSSLFLDQSLAMNRRNDGKERTSSGQEESENVEAYPEMESETSGIERLHDQDDLTRIYGCATMWHESVEEMREMLKSVLRIDEDFFRRHVTNKLFRLEDKDKYEWQTEIYFDDAFKLEKKNSKKQVLNDYVKQFIEMLNSPEKFVTMRVQIDPPKRYWTPYGGRLVWRLPGNTLVVCHLKDKSKIRPKKRWSQCMYMYYLLGHKLMDTTLSVERKMMRLENTYLLALDGDIDFQPKSILRLVDLMKINPNLGAACGRIHPTGSGFMVWYQKFEYAIGHWLQKATEHVMGCVLCSPGCFSLFRGRALIDDNVMAKYTTKSEKPRDFVQYDQGEDRWLCTLLLQQGWRVEYSAASDAYTACPENFDEFFNQRRRWMPSTIANIFDLLSDAKSVVKKNPDISYPYVFYQIMMMVGTILGPGTIFLMLVGAFSVAFGISNSDGFLYNLIPIIGFMVICFLTDSKIQLFVAQVLSAGYGLVMMAVLVGILLQVSQDGPLAPSSLSIFLVGGSFILAAILHPQEFWCLPNGIIYYITIPAMYLLLVIYSIFNLNNVSWGTRESPQQKSKDDLIREEMQRKEALAEAKQQKKSGLLGYFMKQSEENQDKRSMEFSLANLFKCMLFTQDDPSTVTSHKLDTVIQSLDSIGVKLKKLESFNPVSSVRRSSSLKGRLSSSVRFGSLYDSTNFEEALDEEEDVKDEDLTAESSETETSSDEDDDKNEKMPYWIKDKKVFKDVKDVDFLSQKEIKFWDGLIAKYLQPDPVRTKEEEDRQKKKAAELLALRNQMVFSFFMLNAIFVTAIFLLQQNKETIFLRWPLDAKANVSFIPGSSKDTPTIQVAYDYLQLEPIGLVFVVFFAVVLLIQVFGMLLHRWGTLTHIIASTDLPWCSSSLKDDISPDSLRKCADTFVRKIDVLNLEGEGDVEDQPKHRSTHSVTKRPRYTNYEEELREKMQRFQDINPETLAKTNDPTLRALATRRGTLRELQRRNTLKPVSSSRPSSVNQLSIRGTPSNFSSSNRSSLNMVAEQNEVSTAL